MKLRNQHPCGDISVVIPGNPPRQFDVKAGATFTVTKAEADVLLLSSNFVPATKE